MKKPKQTDPKPRNPAEYVRPDLSRTGKVEKMYLIWSRKFFFFFFKLRHSSYYLCIFVQIIYIRIFPPSAKKTKTPKKNKKRLSICSFLFIFHLKQINIWMEGWGGVHIS